MSDRLSRITKNIIRGGTVVAIGASAWACEKGYIVPDSVQTKTPITELVPPPTSTETISNEKISRYGQFEIGEVKIGVISDLKIQTNPDLNIVNKVKDLALLSIPEAKDKEISINIYDMIGDKGTAPFITASVNDSNGNLEFAYVGFSLDENNIQRPPIDGDVDIFYPLRVVEQEDKSVFIGIPDQTTQNLQTPIMFYVDQNNDTYFYPPYTDYLAQNDTTYGGMKVQAMLLKPEIQPSESMLTNNALENGKWGNYSLIENPDGYYEMKDVQGNLIPEVKLFRDGTAELTYSSKKLAVAFEAITIGPEGQLAFGLWNYENGIWSMADTPSIVEVANATEKIDSQGLVIKLGSENTETMWQTAFAARDLLVFDNPSYDPGSELSGISMKVGTEIVDNFDKPPSKWQLFNNNMAVKGAVTMLPVPPAGYNELLYTADMQKNMKGRPFLVALAAGMVPITFVNADDSVQEVAYLVPLIIRDTDSKLIAASTLMREEHVKEVASILNKEKRGLLMPWLITNAQGDDGSTFTDMELTEIMADRNRPIINELMPLLGGKVKVHLRSFPKKLNEALFILLSRPSDW